LDRAGNRTIIVTGASRGLGRAVALRFGAAGDRVAVIYRDREPEARKVGDAISSRGGTAIALRADVRDPSAVSSMVADVLDRWETIDVLVNNAGITRDGLMLRMQEQDWDDVLATDLKGPFLCIREAAQVMSHRRSGHIINIASITGVQGREGQSNYSAAKAGLVGLTKTAARELGPFDIKVNAVLPGFLDTSLGRTVSTAIKERILREHVLGRTTDAEEAAEFIYQLSLMRNVSGQVFNLDNRVL
jgi:3-oxoacyl-[acyl-carrier protein] reductase